MSKQVVFNFISPDKLSVLSINPSTVIDNFLLCSSVYKQGKWKLKSCLWRWKPQYPGCLALFQSTFPMQSSPFPSKNDACLFPHHLHPIQRVLPLPGFHFLCHHSHHPKDAPHSAGCSPSSRPLGHLCLFPLQSLLRQTLCMIPANSNHISISASLIWACWGEDHLERYTR